jgi:hypothetical protein
MLRLAKLAIFGGGLGLGLLAVGVLAARDVRRMQQKRRAPRPYRPVILREKKAWS